MYAGKPVAHYAIADKDFLQLATKDYVPRYALACLIIIHVCLTTIYSMKCFIMFVALK